MKKFNFFLILNLIFVMLTSCGTIKEGFSMQKKDNSDEFLVEKKSPLVMPPNYGDLPIPKSSENYDQKKNNENKIQNLIINNDDSNNDKVNDNSQGQTLEKSLLEKIKQN